MHIQPFLGDHVRSLLHELRIVSGMQFRRECFLLPEEELGPEKRISLFAIVHGKVTVVQSLAELTSAFHGVEQFLLYNKQVPPGYESLAEKYHELMGRRWVIAADKYKRGYDPNPDPDFRTYAYGLIEIDEALLQDVRTALEESEHMIKNAYAAPTSHGSRVKQANGIVGKPQAVRGKSKVVPVTIFILGAIIAIISNVASGVLPTSVHPYLWLSWPLLFFLVMISVLLLLRE